MIIEPQGAGTATETRHILSDPFDGYWVECAATPNKGYRFSHFEWINYAQENDGPVYTSQGLTANNPTTEIYSPQFSDTPGLDISVKSWYEGLKAVFEKEEEKLFTVTTGIFPETAKGTSNGDGTYESGTVVTIDVHQKCNLWIFDHWQFSTGETYSSKSVSFTVSRTVTCTAFFRHENTGELIFDADGSGDLIMGDGGSLLYNGDLVTA